MKRRYLLVSVLVVVLMVLVSVGTALGQEPEGGDPDGPIENFQPAEFPDDVDPGLEGEAAEGEVTAEGGVYVLAQPPTTMNYQGYLTDAGGTPLNGAYNLTFSLYDAAAGGTQEWGPEAHPGVQISNGLFAVTLGTTVDLYPDDFDEALFLQVSVGGDVIATRQPLRPVAYAFGLIPGAEVYGEPAGANNYGLRVENTGNASNDRGLYASGEEYGIYAQELGSGDVGIYSPDYVRAQGFRSNSDSYWWIDANGVQSEDFWSTSGYFSIQNHRYGGVEFDCGLGGDDAFVLPLNVPGVLFGQNVRLEEARVYYRTDNAASYIDLSRVYKSTGSSHTTVDSYEIIAQEYDNQNSTAANGTYYAIPIVATSAYTLTSGSGNLIGFFELYCDNVAHNIYISGMRLKLGHLD